MIINDHHPSVLDFKKNEVQTLTFLRTRRLVKNFPELDQTIQYSLSNYNNIKKLEKNAFEFNTNFPITIEKHKHKIFIESKISENNGNYDEATYSLSIAGKDDSAEVIRKFHFDYAHPSIKTKKQPVPIYHLQYGGKLSPTLQALGMKDTMIDHGLSVPRLYFPPINLAILLDIAFSEFQTEETKKLTEKQEWRELIFNNERFILTGYYCDIATFCSSPSYNKKRLIRDFIYGH